jgi:transcriptional regulator with PAS, ATPase and Fis domain
MPADLQQGFRLDPADLPGEDVIFGGTAAMLDAHAGIERVVETELPVLLQGERGTGKDLVARFLHIRSGRQDRPFVKLCCAATSQRLLEGELMGYEQGAIPGADEAKPGLVEIAEGGTLFLDEIGELGWNLQRKLLLLLQDGRYFRVGGREERQANVRIICSTNVPLGAAVKDGTFRRELFSQMEATCFRLSALRERKQDIPQLWSFFAGKLARKFGKDAPRLTPEVLHTLERWEWPGNLCELENCIARVIILGDEEGIGDELRRQAAPLSIADGHPERSRLARSGSRQMAAEARILQVLRASHWNQRKTAGGLKRSHGSPLYRLRSVGASQRPRRPRRFPRPE